VHLVAAGAELANRRLVDTQRAEMPHGEVNLQGYRLPPSHLQRSDENRLWATGGGKGSSGRPRESQHRVHVHTRRGSYSPPAADSAEGDPAADGAQGTPPRRSGQRCIRRVTRGVTCR
jgi:hypothetical protein